MALEVIGAGFGRTGTLSFKQALEDLGLGPCYHMLEVFGKDDHVTTWEEAIAGRPVDWEALLDGYRSTCDWPACTFWREQRAANPDAKVVLTRRDPDAWFTSITNTIFATLAKPLDEDPVVAHHQRMVAALVAERTFGGRFDRDHVLEVLAAHERDVIESVPADRTKDYGIIDASEIEDGIFLIRDMIAKPTGPRRRRSWSWPEGSMAAAPRGTGRPRARSSSACGR